MGHSVFFVDWLSCDVGSEEALSFTVFHRPYPGYDSTANPEDYIERDGFIIFSRELITLGRYLQCQMRTDGPSVGEMVPLREPYPRFEYNGVLDTMEKVGILIEYPSELQSISEKTRIEFMFKAYAKMKAENPEIEDIQFGHEMNCFHSGVAPAIGRMGFKEFHLKLNMDDVDFAELTEYESILVMRSGESMVSVWMELWECGMRRIGMWAAFGLDVDESGVPVLVPIGIRRIIGSYLVPYTQVVYAITYLTQYQIGLEMERTAQFHRCAIVYFETFKGSHITLLPEEMSPTEDDCPPATRLKATEWIFPVPQYLRAATAANDYPAARLRPDLVETKCRGPLSGGGWVHHGTCNCRVSRLRPFELDGASGFCGVCTQHLPSKDPVFTWSRMVKGLLLDYQYFQFQVMRRLGLQVGIHELYHRLSNRREENRNQLVWWLSVSRKNGGNPMPHQIPEGIFTTPRTCSSAATVISQWVWTDSARLILMGEELEYEAVHGPIDDAIFMDVDSPSPQELARSTEVALNGSQFLYDERDRTRPHRRYRHGNRSDVMMWFNEEEQRRASPDYRRRQMFFDDLGTSPLRAPIFIPRGWAQGDPFARGIGAAHRVGSRAGPECQNQVGSYPLIQRDLQRMLNAGEIPDPVWG